MGLLSQFSAGTVHDTTEGRRVFRHGLVFTKRCVFVNAEEERRLRRAFERGVLANILLVALSGPFMPLWVRLLVMVPTGMIVLEVVLRQMTAGLPPAATPPAPFTSSSVEQAKAAGRKLLWFQLAFFVGFVALCSSNLVSYEDLGWRKYAGIAIGLAMIAQVIHQLVLLRRTEAAKENGRR
jgi:hypothetical protein